MGLSSYSNYPLEDVAAQGKGNPYVMQVCVLRDRSLTLQLLERAESASSFASQENDFLIFLFLLLGLTLHRGRIQGPLFISGCTCSRKATERIPT